MIRILIVMILIGIAGNSSARDFMGYECTQDCSGHEAGYEWAEQKGITSEGDCGGNSNSFIEGCQAYVESITADSHEEQNEED